jgi:succinylglutamate desuccinylase
MNKYEITGDGTNNILILTGVHGNEFTPLYCGYLLKSASFNKENFKKITILNAINENGIKNNSREIQYNSTNDLNRKFDVNDNEININELITAFNENDVIIDVHSSPKCTEFALLNQNEYTNSYVHFLVNNNINYLIRYSNTNTIKKYCLDLNKISFTVELNQISYIDYDSAEKGVQIIQKIVNNIQDFELYNGEPYYDEFFEYFTYKEGLFIPKTKCGDIIEFGQHIGQLLNLKTFELEDLYYTKEKAIIICSSEHQYVSANNSIYFLQPI